MEVVIGNKQVVAGILIDGVTGARTLPPEAHPRPVLPAFALLQATVLITTTALLLGFLSMVADFSMT